MRSRVDSHMQQLLVAESQVASAVALNLANSHTVAFNTVACSSKSRIPATEVAVRGLNLTVPCLPAPGKRFALPPCTTIILLA
eukprot:1158008-Pelagomonas_calceolata.AAC.7